VTASNGARYRWLVLAVFVLSTAINILDRATLAALAPLLKQEFGLTNAQYGWITSAFNLTYAVSAPVAGMLIDSLGLNRVISFAVGLWSCAGIATGFTRGLGGLVGCRAVLVNPAVDPARDLAAHIGRQTMYHAAGETFDFRAEYVDELRAMAPPVPLAHPGNILAIVAKGDEVLDWREMTARYAHGPLKLIAGSDHGLTDFESHVPDLLRHLGL